MNDAKLNKIGRLFWLAIAILLTVSLFVYLVNKRPDLLILAFAPIISMAGYMLAGRLKGNVHYYAKNVTEYITENSLFFLVFLFTIFYMRDYLFLKVVSFAIMSAVGTFNTYSMIKLYRRTFT